MAAKNYLDPKGYWGDPSGNIRRMSGEQEIVATVTGECSEAEWKALCNLAGAPRTARPTGFGNARISDENP
jgi:hypothetical protein